MGQRMDFEKSATRSIPKSFTLIKCGRTRCIQTIPSIGYWESFKAVLAMVAPFITKIGHRHYFSSMISLSKVSAIFNFEIMWASNPISMVNWLIWLSPIHTFTAHGEESAFGGQKYQTWQIFSSRCNVANSQENSAAHERKQLSKLLCQAIC